jgi:hypothetical protein
MALSNLEAWRPILPQINMRPPKHEQGTNQNDFEEKIRHGSVTVGVNIRMSCLNRMLCANCVCPSRLTHELSPCPKPLWPRVGCSAVLALFAGVRLQCIRNRRFHRQRAALRP